MSQDGDGSGKSDAKPPPGDDAKGDDKATAKADDKASSKADDKATAKADDKPGSKSDAKSAGKSEPKPAAKAAAKSDETAKSSAKAEDKGTPEKEGEPPLRPSQSLLEIEAPMTFPDDGALSGIVRRLDHFLGTCEQAVLFAILATVVLTASANAILDKATGDTIWWSYDVIRGGTFAVAMMGAAFATHQSRHLAMDLISRSLPRRARLVLTALLEIFTIVICCVLARSGLTQVEIAGEETGRHMVTAKQIAMFLPVGAGLIIVHSLLHLVIDIDYLVRGKLLPERARSGH